MKTITEYLVNNHIKKTTSLFIKDMSAYKAISYDRFTYYKWDDVSDDVFDIFKKLYNEETQDNVVEFIEKYYPYFINMQFNDKRINDDIKNLMDNSNVYCSTGALVDYYKRHRQKNNVKYGKFTKWALPILFNVFIKCVDEINKK